MYIEVITVTVVSSLKLYMVQLCNYIYVSVLRLGLELGLGVRVTA
jgi:hypothetical protein